eukprot:evm.model.NODE_37847_length_9729_cov_19.569328.1
MAEPTSLIKKKFAVWQGSKRVARAWSEHEEEEEEYNDKARHDVAEDTSTIHTSLRSRRSLGGFEQFMFKAHQIGCGLIYMVAELEHKGGSSPTVLPLPNARLVEHALRLTIARHPNLRARITADGEQLEVLSMEEVSPAAWVVPFVVTEGREGGGGVVEFVKEEIKRTPIALGRCEGSFWQLFLVQEEEQEGGKEGGVKQSLVVFAHHSIMDGESVVLFLKEIVAGIEDLLRQETYRDSNSSNSNSSSHYRNDAGKEQSPASLALDFLPSQDELFETVLPPTPGDGLQ